MPPLLRLAIVGDVVPGPTLPEGASVARAVSLLQSADVAFGNLETAVTSRGARVEKLYHMRVTPSALDTLAHLGFSVMSVANNHTLDYGLEGFADTMRLLREKGISPVGGGRDLHEAWQPATAGGPAPSLPKTARHLRKLPQTRPKSRASCCS